MPPPQASPGVRRSPRRTIRGPDCQERLDGQAPLLAPDPDVHPDGESATADRRPLLPTRIREINRRSAFNRRSRGEGS